MLSEQGKLQLREDLKKKIVRSLYNMKGCIYFPTSNIMTDLNIDKDEVSSSPIVLNELLFDGLIESNRDFTKLTTKGIIYASEILN